MKAFKLVFTSASIEQIREIADWYEQRQKGLGKRFKSNLKSEISKIKRNPLHRSFRYDNIRLAVIKPFPYAAHYSVDEQQRRIVIHAVFGFRQGLKTG